MTRILINLLCLFLSGIFTTPVLAKKVGTYSTEEQIKSAKVKVTRTSGGLKVTIRDSGKSKGLVLNCYYVLVGPLKILG